MRPPALLFGVAVENVTMAETIELIDRLVEAGRRRSVSHQVATINADFLANALADPSLAHILRSADVCLADGMPIVWSARLLGMPIVERVAGADLVPLLFQESERRGWRIHVVGSSPDVAERARQMIADRHPGANVSIDPDAMVAADGEVDGAVLDALAEIDADIICVALGNPKQERFIARHRERIGAPVMIGVGGSLDMMTGERRRAPEWAQRSGLEWVVRAVQEPKRLGPRYAHDIRSLGPWLQRELRAQRRRRALPGLGLDVRPERIGVMLGTEQNATNAEWSAAAGHLTAGAELHLHVEDATTRGLQDRAAAMLVGLIQAARRAGGSPDWVSDPHPLRPAFEPLHLESPSVHLHGEW